MWHGKTTYNKKKRRKYLLILILIINSYPNNKYLNLTFLIPTLSLKLKLTNFKFVTMDECIIEKIETAKL